MQPEPESEQPELVKPAPGQLRAPLRCRIESDPAVMQALHERYRWVPGAESIRPNPDVLEKKKAYQANTERFYASDVDCVLDLVFDCPTSCAAPTAASPVPRQPELMPKVARTSIACCAHWQVRARPQDVRACECRHFASCLQTEPVSIQRPHRLPALRSLVCWCGCLSPDRRSGERECVECPYLH